MTSRIVTTKFEIDSAVTSPTILSFCILLNKNTIGLLFIIHLLRHMHTWKEKFFLSKVKQN